MVDDVQTPAGAGVAPKSVRATDRFGVLGRSTFLRHSLVAVIAIVVLYGLVQSLSELDDIQYVAPIAYTLCAVAGLTLLTGLSGQISLGNGAFMAVGAYTFALLINNWHTAHGNLQLIGLLAACVAVAAVFGAVVGLAAARLRGPYLAGATLALALGLPSLAYYSKLEPHLGGANGLSFTPANPPNGFNINRWPAFVCCIAAVVTLWVCANVMRSRVGRSFRAVRDDEVAAALSGLSVARIQVVAFIISAGCAGLAGGLLAYVQQTVGPQAFDLSLSLSLLAAAVFGGLGSLAGAVYGSILVWMLPFWAHDITDALSINSGKISANLPLMVYGVVLAVSMLAVPDGLQGALRRLVRRLRAARRA